MSVAMPDLFIERELIFSPGAEPVYRYRFTRIWDRALPRLLIVMLNPSVASLERNDPTSVRVFDFAHRWGCGALSQMNLYGLISAVPAALRDHPDPVGPDNDSHLLAEARRANLAVVAWGADVMAPRRAAAVLDLLRQAGRTPMCIRTTKGGFPEHPLYLPKGLQPVPYEVAA